MLIAVLLVCGTAAVVGFVVGKSCQNTSQEQLKKKSNENEVLPLSTEVKTKDQEQ